MTGRWILAVAVAAALSGCVERELRVESDPPGADVYIDGEKVGRTPYAVPFTFYGTREVSLRLDGYAAERQRMPVQPPWYQIIPLDLFFELVWPWTLRDERTLRVTLTPLREEDPNVLLQRAREWRDKARAAGE